MGRVLLPMIVLLAVGIANPARADSCRRVLPNGTVVSILPPPGVESCVVRRVFPAPAIHPVPPANLSMRFTTGTIGPFTTGHLGPFTTFSNSLPARPRTR